MRSLGDVAYRVARRAVALAESRRAAPIVFIAAFAVWWIEALVIPLAQGRDLGTYLGAYVQLFWSDPIDLGYVLGRTPVASVLIGGLLELAGGFFAEPAMALLFAGSITAWFLVARSFSARAAVLVVLVLLCYPGYAILFHELSSDALFAAAFAGWSLFVVRVLRSPTVAGFAALGAGVGVVALIRPGNQVLLALALLAAVVKLPWRARVLSAAAFVVPAVVLLGGWAVHNGLRYDNYTVARGGNATVPFFRTFVTDKLVRPENGPATRELARAVEARLLQEEPYRSYGITLDEFFSEASPRMQVDLLALSDRLKGWSSNYSWLREVGTEAVRAHPGAYTRGVIGSFWGMLTHGLFRNLDTGGAAEEPSGSAAALSEGAALPTPSEGEPIPAAHEGGITTPDGSIYTVWTSPTEHHLVFVHPGDEARYVELHRRIAELGAELPDRGGNATLALKLNQSSRWFPPPVLWLALGLVALALRRPAGALALATPSAAALIVIGVSALGLPAEPHYTVPVAPAFVLLAAAGMLGPAAEAAPARFGRSLAALRARLPVRSGLAAAVILGGAAAAWAVDVYVSYVRARVDAGELAQDVGVFVRAASAIFDGASPYVFRGDQTYAYPPLLAFLAAPLEPLGVGAAMTLSILVSLAAIGGALWLLGVRDWRCYLLVPLYPVTRSAVGLGTIGPLLLLATAAAWHWRGRLLRPALAVGAAIALKLFLWPVAIWLALIGRARAAVAAVGFALALVFVPWAAIGFRGLADYPSLLDRLADQEASASYSVFALGVRAHLPEAAATVLAILVTGALLLLALRVARDERRTPRDRDAAALTLAIAAALAASPIVWVHYFLLLLVPIALTRPRLSPLWLVPLAYFPLGETAWPGGDARKLALALATTAAVLVASLWPDWLDRVRSGRRVASAKPVRQAP